MNKTSPESARRLSTSHLMVMVAIFLEGWVSIGIEVITLRQLVPVAGTSIPVTATAIGLFLLFLAMGYYFGGKVQDGYLSKVGRNFLLTGLWIGFSLSSLTTTLFFALDLPVMAKLWLYLLICVAPPVFWLGQTVPVLSNLVKSSRVGEASGTALFLSTIGSFLGSLMISILLMRYWGVSATLFVISLGIVLMGLTLTRAVGVSARMMTTAVLAIALGAVLNLVLPGKWFTAQTAYADYSVRELQVGLAFIQNNQAASMIAKNGEHGPYVEAIRKMLDELGVRDREILVIGAGGFTISALRAGNNPNQYHYVDIDPDIKEIVVSSGFLDRVNGDVVAEDGRHFLHQAVARGKRYPVIVVDSFSSGLSVPPHFGTVEFHHEVRSALAPDGIAIYNMVLDPMLKSRLAQNFLGSIQAEFGVCAIHVMSYATPRSNVLVTCTPEAERPARRIYRDERNDMPFDLFSAGLP